jgi:hypothetical protein
VSCAAREYLEVLDEAAFGTTGEADPAACWLQPDGGRRPACGYGFRRPLERRALKETPARWIHLAGDYFIQTPKDAVASLRRALLIAPPTPAAPRIIMAQVDASGTLEEYTALKPAFAPLRSPVVKTTLTK